MQIKGSITVVPNPQPACRELVSGVPPIVKIPSSLCIPIKPAKGSANYLHD